jgi:hypothetical protein
VVGTTVFRLQVGDWNVPDKYWRSVYWLDDF